MKNIHLLILWTICTLSLCTSAAGGGVANATSTTSAPKPAFEFPEYKQRFSDNVLDQRLCVSIVTGFDFISYALSLIMERYIKFYNDPLHFRYKRFHT